AFEDVPQGPRRIETVDGINSDNDEIALRHFEGHRSKGRIAGPPAVPMWLAINLHRAKELWQAGRSEQGIDRDILVGEDAPPRGADVGCAQDKVDLLLRTQAIEIDQLQKHRSHRIGGVS